MLSENDSRPDGLVSLLKNLTWSASALELNLLMISPPSHLVQDVS